MESNHKLLRLLGVGFGIAITLGGTIGTGILRKPGPIAAALGDGWLLMGIWVAVGIYSLLGVLCAIELGVSVPRAGAWYVYAQRAFGQYIGFVVGLTSWLGTVTALAFGAYTIGEYVALLFPQTESYIRLMAVVLLLVLSFFHAQGVRIAGSSQQVMSFIKAVCLLAFVAACFIFGEKPSTSQVAVLPSTGLFAALMASLMSVFYAYDGWHTAAYFAEENADPAKSLPKSMIGGVLLIMIIYLLVNLAILHVVPLSQLANAKLAAADAVAILFGEGSGKAVTLFLLISILGIVNAQMMFAPRVIYSMSRDGLFPKAIQYVNKGGTPVWAMLLTAGCSMLLMLSGKDICGRLSDIATFFFVMGYTSGFISLIALRRKEPHLPRPFKVPFYPYLPALMAVISVLFLLGAVYQDFQNSLYALILLALSYPLFRLMTRK